MAERLARLSTRWELDAILVVGLGACGFVAGATSGLLVARSAAAVTACIAGLCGALAVRRFQPVAAGLVAGAAVALPVFTHIAGRMNNGFNPLFLCPFLIAYWLGAHTEPVRSTLGLTPLVVGTAIAVGVNPLAAILTVGPWVGGALVRSRRRVADELALRGRELAEEQRRYAAEAVRLERARVARELHDIVAHCISLIVVQAGAGQRLLGRDPVAAGQAFALISEVAGQADLEIDRLVAMLGDPAPVAPSLGMRMIDELVGRASGLGLTVSYRFIGEAEGLSPAAEDAAYRAVQEALTNALKHAPGAPVEIAVDCSDARVQILVANRRGRGAGLGLAPTGGSHGLAGMTERVAACGGTVEAGPTPQGGWAVAVWLPKSR